MIRSFSTALKSIRRSPYQALVAILMMTLSFFVATCFVFMLFIAGRALQYIETRPQVIGYFAVGAPDEEILQAKQMLEEQPFVASVHMVTKQDALRIFQEENKKDPLLSELVTADILPASVEVSAHAVSELATISEFLASVPGIEEVVYQKELISKLSSWSTILRQSGIAITVILFCITSLLVFVILSLRVSGKRKEIGIMNLLGASQWYIRGPYVIEGLLYGIIGSTVGWLMGLTVLLYATPTVVHFFGMIPVLPIPLPLLATMAGVSALVGIILGLFSSVLAVSRFIR